REVDDVSGNEKREQREQHVQQAGREPRHGGCAPGMERHPPVKGLAGHDAGETPETPVARTMALSAPSMLMVDAGLTGPGAGVSYSPMTREPPFYQQTSGGKERVEYPPWK